MISKTFVDIVVELFSFLKNVMEQSGQKRCTFLKMGALYNGGNHLFHACSRRIVFGTT